MMKLCNEHKYIAKHAGNLRYSLQSEMGLKTCADVAVLKVVVGHAPHSAPVPHHISPKATAAELLT